MANRTLIPLGEGIYTVSEVCRILGRKMTPRRVHYWIRTGLLSDPLERGRPGRPTLLTFRHLIEIRTVQRLKDELGFSLPRVRGVFEWILARLFVPDLPPMEFTRGVGGTIVVKSGTELLTLPAGQGVLPGTLEEMTETVRSARRDWEGGVVEASGCKWIVSNRAVMAGAPTIRGTRIETSLIAAIADVPDDRRAIGEVAKQYDLPWEAIDEAVQFEARRAA